MVEGWHGKFQELMGIRHPSIWRFIDMLKDEQQSNEQLSPRLLVVTLQYCYQLHSNTDKIKFV